MQLAVKTAEQWRWDRACSLCACAVGDQAKQAVPPTVEQPNDRLSRRPYPDSCLSRCRSGQTCTPPRSQRRFVRQHMRQSSCPGEALCCWHRSIAGRQLAGSTSVCQGTSLAGAKERRSTKKAGTRAGQQEQQRWCGGCVSASAVGSAGGLRVQARLRARRQAKQGRV